MSSCNGIGRHRSGTTTFGGIGQVLQIQSNMHGLSWEAGYLRFAFCPVHPVFKRIQVLLGGRVCPATQYCIWEAGSQSLQLRVVKLSNGSPSSSREHHYREEYITLTIPYAPSALWPMHAHSTHSYTYTSLHYITPHYHKSSIIECNLHQSTCSFSSLQTMHNTYTYHHR